MRKNPIPLVWALILAVSSIGARTAGVSEVPSEVESASAPAGPVETSESPAIVEEVPTRSLPIPPAGPVPSGAELQRMIDRAATRQALDRDLAHALIKAESAYDPHAVSPAGAVGLMQVMPETGADYGVSSIDLLFDPETNLRAGMRHLKRLIDKYDSVGHAVMAYNVGEGALERGNGFVDYPETRRYTYQVLTEYLGRKGIEPYSARARLVLGMALTPHMALSGVEGRSVAARGSSEFNGLTNAAPLGEAPGHDDRIGVSRKPGHASRLSSRLATPTHSLLTTRLLEPGKRRARESRIGSGALGRAQSQ